LSSHSNEAPVAIVTGAGRGLGREHALALARAGWRLVVNDLGGAGDGTGTDDTPAAGVAAEIEAMGGDAVSNSSNVANWNAAQELVKTAIDTFGRLDGLVNNAGILRDRTIANITEDDWDLSIAVNLKGTAAPLHHAARYWRDVSKSRGKPIHAAVVNTTSASGLYSGTGQANYAAAKAAVASLTLVAARELARYGVRVNCVGPAAATRLTEAVMGEAMKERLDPALVSPLVVYLLGLDAKDVSGRVFEMGGGSIVVVDMPRPGASLRSAEGKWTSDRLARAMPGLLEQMREPMNPRDAMSHLMQAPTDPHSS
jgi:NAD(P)-dependent dehydrogenase (short-subunit alcohol dehydrogenase family)